MPLAVIVLQLAQDGAPLQRSELRMVAKDPGVDPQTDRDGAELHHQPVEELVAQLLNGLRLKVELTRRPFRLSEQPMHDLPPVSRRSKVAALRRRNCEEAENEAALVHDEVVRCSGDRRVVCDGVRWCVASRYAHGSERSEGAILGDDDWIAAGALNLGDDGPRDVTKSHRRRS